MRIGIVTVLSGLGGGLYQHSLNILHALDLWKREGCQDEFVLFVDNTNHPIIKSLTEHGWEIKPMPSSSKQHRVLDILRQIVGEGPHREVWRRLRQKFRQSKKEELANPEIVRFNPQMSRWLHRCGIDLMFYSVPTPMSFETGIPYVTFIMDLQHRLQPHFPEVSADGEWERREYLFRNAIRYATLLFVDSEAGKDDVLTFYGSYGITSD
ncbi:MAG TPA: hypothetical protein ENG96_04780, partial [Gammaproteobacteria bacterium]|nr:hypothetical protein [Gammaproteobacteria bacterium]